MERAQSCLPGGEDRVSGLPETEAPEFGQLVCCVLWSRCAELPADSRRALLGLPGIGGSDMAQPIVP